MKLSRTIAGKVAGSFVFARARRLLEANLRDWHYPLGRWGKLQVGVCLILRDYADGRFPPRFGDEGDTFAGERAYYETLRPMGRTAEEQRLGALRKPFWSGPTCARHMRDFGRIVTALHARGIRPPARLLEAGAGCGWTAEFFAASGFRVTATSLDPADGELIDLRRRSVAAKGLPAELEFRASPMEYLAEAVRGEAPFDAVYVYEALHHAHDWRKAIRSFRDCLADGGWCFLLNEPNAIHTLVSYRVGRLSGTHEIGLRPAELKRELRRAGFRRVETLWNRFHGWVRPIWFAAQR